MYTLGPCACTINACSDRGQLLAQTEYQVGHNEIAAMRERLAEAGRKHWEEFHLRVWTLEQLADWESRIPAEYGCDCAANYRTLKEQAVEPVLSVPWKVEVHNLINRKLLKSDFSIPAAKERWGYQEEAG